MPTSYEQIAIETILNYEGPNTGEIARYDRIMQHRAIEAMNGLSNRLQGVMATIHTAAQLAQETANKAMEKYDAAALAEERRQKAMKSLTVALVLATIFYTGINAFVAYEMILGNRVQAEVAAAAKEQAKAAREANDIQRGKQ